MHSVTDHKSNSLIFNEIRSPQAAVKSVRVNRVLIENEVSELQYVYISQDEDAKKTLQPGDRSAYYKQLNHTSENRKFEIVSISNKIVNNYKKLKAIADLPENWNGNHAGAFSKKLIERIESIILLLNVQPEIFPTACNSIQLEYDKPDGSHMEIEIEEHSEEAEVYQRDQCGNDQIYTLPVSIKAINEAVRQFYG